MYILFQYEIINIIIVTKLKIAQMKTRSVTKIREPIETLIFPPLVSKRRDGTLLKSNSSTKSLFSEQNVREKNNPGPINIETEKNITKIEGRYCMRSNSIAIDRTQSPLYRGRNLNLDLIHSHFMREKSSFANSKRGKTLLAEIEADNFDKIVNLILNDQASILEIISKDKVDSFYKENLFYESQGVDLENELDKIMFENDKQYRNKGEMVGFFCIENIIKRIKLIDYEKGKLLNKAFKYFIKNNEEKWKNILALCLNQSVNKFRSTEIDQDIHQVLNVKEITGENLADHKLLLKRLLKELIKERKNSSELIKNIKFYETELAKWISEYDILKNSKKINEQLENYKPVLITEVQNK